jgi:MoxR-like ATPase
LAAKARALIKGRFCVSTEDLRAVALSVLRHRIKINFSAQAENVNAMQVIRKLLEAVPVEKDRA